MHILICNGSPKGAYSITWQTLRYIEMQFPEHTFETIPVGQRIRALTADPTPLIEACNRAEAIVFSYPVYTFIAPSQLHYCFELLKQLQQEGRIQLRGKWASQVTTSKHFYDMTAHRYVEENCGDLGMSFVRGLSADMDDLLQESGRKDACAFFSYLLFCMETGLREPTRPVAPAPALVEATAAPVREKAKGDVLVLTDCEEGNTRLQGMIDRFCASSPVETRVLNLREFPFMGGCLGCFRCAVSGKCVYRDGFDTFLRTSIQTAQAIVYAFRVRDHSMGALFKMYDDRNFCNGHRTVTEGMPVGYLVDGAYGQEENLRTILEARAQVGGNFLAGVATNEQDPDGQIDALAQRLGYALSTGYEPPRNFFGVGGMKIFRDLIWLMQGMMRADHKFYKKQGHYDFPQKHRLRMWKMYLVGFLLSNEKIVSRMGNKMNEGMLAPYTKILQDNAPRK